MSREESSTGPDKRRSNAVGFIESLDRAEVKLLVCLVGGMSRSDLASCFGVSVEEAQLLLRSTLEKIEAVCIADAVRISILAGLDRNYQD